jgi:hypothetical protein
LSGVHEDELSILSSQKAKPKIKRHANPNKLLGRIEKHIDPDGLNPDPAQRRPPGRMST